jgi:hypothetical protein
MLHHPGDLFLVCLAVNKLAVVGANQELNLEIQLLQQKWLGRRSDAAPTDRCASLFIFPEYKGQNKNRRPC